MESIMTMTTMMKRTKLHKWLSFKMVSMKTQQDVSVVDEVVDDAAPYTATRTRLISVVPLSTVLLTKVLLTTVSSTPITHSMQHSRHTRFSAILRLVIRDL